MKVEKVARAKAHTRYYTKQGRVPGVTTILSVINKPALVPWANKLGLQGIDTRKYVDSLADIGTLSHQWIMQELGGEKVDMDQWSKEQQDRASNSVIKFLDWKSKHKIEVIAMETPLVSEAYQYGGTTDLIAKVDGVLGIVDIKTGKAIYDDMMYQVGAYFMLGAEAGHEIEEGRIVQVGRSEEEGFNTKVAPYSQLWGYWEVFEAALNLYYAIKRSKK